MMSEERMSVRFRIFAQRQEDGAADVVAAAYYVVPTGHCVTSVLRVLAIATIWVKLAVLL